ncbi:MAG: radical SAM protein [Lachnospiraceae bacterium]|nr:radical SAM protein [Lachnospiraceae bacterium]
MNNNGYKEQKNKRIACVMPPYFRLIESKNNRLTPAMHYVAECLDKLGYEVTLINGDYSNGTYADRISMNKNSWLFQRKYMEKHPAYDEVIEILKEFKPHFVFISAGDVLLPTVEISNPDTCIFMAEKIKKEISEDIVCVGYGHLLKYVMGSELDIFDAVITCEAEGVLEDIIENNLRGMIDNYWLNNMDDLPVLTDKYLYYDAEPNDWDYIMSMRGCYNSCSFCLQPSLRCKKVSMMSPERFSNEIIYRIENFHIYDFYISDLMFLAENIKRTDRMLELFSDIKNKYPHFSWRAEYRVDMINNTGFLEKLKMAGCRHIKFGVEMMNDKMLEKINKGITVSQIERAFELTKEVGISRTAYILLGCPGFKDKDYQEMWIRFKNLNADNYVVNINVPYMGTKLYDIMKERIIDYGLFKNGEEGYIHVSKIMQKFWEISDETVNMYFMLKGAKEDQIYREYKRKIVNEKIYQKTGKIEYMM